MSVVKRIIENNLEKVEVDELLAKEYEGAGYGGIQLTTTPLGVQINLYAMRPGRVIGKGGRAVKAASAKLEEEMGLQNPQITVIEMEQPELDPQIMAGRVANALERGIHYRRAIFWSLNRIMDSGALGCEIFLKGPLRSARSRFERVTEGYVPKSGDPALRNVKTATLHVKMKRGTLGVTVKIVPPDAKFPDKVSIDELPDIQYKQSVDEEIEEETDDNTTSTDTEKESEPKETTEDVAEPENVTVVEETEAEDPDTEETSEDVEETETVTVVEETETKDTDTEETSEDVAEPEKVTVIEETEDPDIEEAEETSEDVAKPEKVTTVEEKEVKDPDTEEAEETSTQEKQDQIIEKEAKSESPVEPKQDVKTEQKPESNTETVEETQDKKDIESEEK